MTHSMDDRLAPFFEANHVPEVHQYFSAFIEELVGEARLDARKAHYNATFHINRKLVYDIVISTYIDIARHKEFHFDNPRTKKSDAVKRAAYFTKWIVRFRPIQILLKESVSDPNTENDAPVLLNELLAMEWGICCIAQDAGLSDLMLKRKSRTNLLYDLHFRDLNVDGLLAMYQLISDIAKTGQENPVLEFPTR